MCVMLRITQHRNGDRSMKLHEIKSRVHDATDLTVMNEDGAAVSVLVTGDQPEMVPVVGEKLTRAGFSFSETGGRKFKGKLFVIHLVNNGSAFNADWEFAAR